ncbi:MAG: RAQPRD family integrative conjugative element protein [gamma proteobacterium symbiont of Lucinoma myriamae]|nr:RAQPRD family integrative conjugative element protein [gamma proteobacterium symbiont of Lucinoma myriamae]MCU7817781.1 RAQPRD family integrative conjugative element protein [gamma proteobacterium symbiont of Lucinoma myriamae]MCU7833370.1 RAQPRD family integrative conjugative element protein [gamma proteobacterium symbiont of Lucinoma myriamae]
MKCMNQKKWLSAAGVCFLCLWSVLGQAQEDLERKYLALLVNEITAIEMVLHKAEENKNKDARVTFQYEWLRADLLKMKSGIQGHINAPRTMPRKVAPLQGDYRQ